MRAPYHLLHVFSTFAVGGPQVRTATLLAALGRGFRHTIVTLDGRSDAEALLGDAVDYRVRRLALDSGWSGLWRNLRRCRHYIAEAAPDLLLTYNFGAMEAALARRWRPSCPHLHFEDGFGPDESTRQLPRRVWLRRLALSGDSLIVVPSRTLERIARERWRFRGDRVLHIPNGIDLERFTAAAPAPHRPLRRTPEEHLIGTVGMLRPEKNLPRLLRIFARLDTSRPTRLVVTGDGSERPMLEALAAELGLADRVTFTGHCPAPETVLAELDVFALTSDTEQMPYSVIEAMAAGLPVVATDVGDVRSLLPEVGQVHVHPPPDEAGFATSLGRLLDSPDLRRSLGAANLAHARQHFDLDLMVRRYETLFTALLANGSPRTGLPPVRLSPRLP
jgi:glycosyltransferase involved in cell wall biosynthesis